MSRSSYISPKSLITELSAGIYLLTIKDVKSVYNDPADGTTVITFVSGGKRHQQDFKLGSSKLNKLLSQCDIDPSLPVTKGEIIGKKIWGYIRAVYKVKNYKIAGEPDFKLFYTSTCVDVNFRPVHSDDPILNEDRFVGEFCEYLEEATA